MTLTELKDKANLKLTPFWNTLIEKQPLYWQKHGKFFQLLVTPRVVDGVDTDWVMQHPSDEHHQVDVDFPWTDQIPFSISVDEWVGSDVGFSATAIVELPNGDKYSRTRKATAIIQEATWDNSDIDNPVELTPRTITDFTQEDTNWQLIDDSWQI